MNLLPIFLKLEGRPCLLVGAGNVALEKISSLLRTGLALRVIAPQARSEIRQMHSEGKLEWIERCFEPSDLDGNLLVIAATNDPAVNRAVYLGALERSILCNSVDDIPNCDFFFGSVVRRGDLQIAISTAGNSPAVAQRLRREIDEQLPEDLGAWLDTLGRLRREILDGTHPVKHASYCFISLRSVHFANRLHAHRDSWQLDSSRTTLLIAYLEKCSWLVLVPVTQTC